MHVDFNLWLQLIYHTRNFFFDTFLMKGNCRSSLNITTVW
jgi:hypothetical protein